MDTPNSEKTTNLHRLSSNRIHWASSSDLELVEHHVPESLVVHNAKIDVCRELLPGDSRIHRFVAVVVVSSR